MGQATTFSYCVNAAAGDCMNAATGTGYVTVTDADGNQYVHDYQQGTLAAQSDWTGTTGGLTFTNELDYGPDVTEDGSTTAGTLDTTWATNGDGAKTTYTYDANGDTVQVTSPSPTASGTVSTTAWFNAQGNQSCAATAEAATPCSSAETGPASVAAGRTITPPSSAPPAGVTYSLSDTDGNKLYATTGVYSPSGSYEYAQTSYQLFKNNSVTLGSSNITCTTQPPTQELPCATINPDGTVTQLKYNSQGDLTSSSVPDGNSGGELATTTWTYDPDGEQVNETAPDGNISGANAGNYTSTGSWNADGEQRAVTHGNGTGYTDTPRTTSYGYDADGNQTTVQDARGYTTTTGYNADDEATMVTDADGNQSLTCYDGDGNLAETVPSAGVAANGLTASSCASSYPSGYGNRLASDATTITYNAAGAKTAMTTPDPAGQSSPAFQTTTYAYDGAGNLTQVSAPPDSTGGPAQITVSTYNPAGKLISQTAGYGTSAASTTTDCYDPNGDHTAVVMPDANTSSTAACETASPWVVSSSGYPTQAAYQTTASYDSAGEQVSTTSPATTAAPSGATTTSTYDAAGQLLTLKDPNGITTTSTYTPNGNAASISYSGSSAHAVSYSYDADGARTAMTDGTGNSSYIYDSFGELTSETSGANQTTGYGYDADGDGDTTAITYPLPSSASSWDNNNPTITYGYDHTDALTSATDFTGNQISITPNADGLPSAETLGASGDTITTTYDNTDTPSAITLKNSSSTLQSFSYSDAPDGSILSETDVPSSTSASYTYDGKGRLASMTTGGNPAVSYAFDASGNLTALPGGATGTYDHDSELTSEVLSGTTTSYTYDADGNRLTSAQGGATQTSGTWNGAGDLTAYTSPAAVMSAAGSDGDGLRQSATFTPAGGSATTEGYVWAITGSAPQLLMDSATAYVYAGSGAPSEQVSLASGTVTYLNTDSLGSVRGIVSATGVLTASTSYDAWGNPQTSGGLTASTPFGYAGAYTDPDGQLYLINRYHDPATGQFTSVDPAVAAATSPLRAAATPPPCEHCARHALIGAVASTGQPST